MAGGGGPAAPGTTWNPSDKSSAITLAFTDSQATKSAGGDAWASVRAILGRSTGKFYFEIDARVNSGYQDAMYGIAKASLALDGGSGFAGGGSAGESYSIYQRDGNKWTAGSGASLTTGWPNANVILGFAVDLDAGLLFISKAGVYPASQDPVAGTNPAFSGLSGTFYPMASFYNGGTNYYGIIQAGAGELTYAPPTGYAPWG